MSSTSSLNNSQGLGNRGPLQTVLFLCENLHNSSSTASASSSLRLLVPLHQSLCQAASLHRPKSVTIQESSGDTTTTKNEGAAAIKSRTPSSSPLESIINTICNGHKDDAALCRDILLSKEPTASSGKQKNKKGSTPVVMMKQLATIQFLLYQDMFQKSPKKGLAKIVLPWLLEYLPLQYLQTQDQLEEDAVTTQEDVPASLPPACLEMLEALMDAIFETAGTSSSLDGIQDCLDLCLQELPSATKKHAEWGWTLQGRVLLRLHTWISEMEIYGKGGEPITNEAQVRVLQALTDKCLQAIKSSGSSSSSSSATTVFEMAAWLRPMTNDWLPYWLEHAPRSSSVGVEQLWHCLWDTYLSATAALNKRGGEENQDSTTTTPVPLSIIPTTSILCTIIPSLLERELPVPDTYGNITSSSASAEATSTTATPTHQPCLWELIHTCLRQGIPRKPQTEKLRNSDVVIHQQAQMMRRRGLFLMRMIIPSSGVAGDSTAAAAGTCSNDGKKKKKMGGKKDTPKEDPFILLWKKYVQVMETLEMETQQHLIEQVWDTLVEIFAACHQPRPSDVEVANAGAQEATSTTTGSTSATGAALTPPPMTWHWTQLLLSRVITSYEEPMIRKLAMYRFLNGEAGISLKKKQSSSDGNGALDPAKNDNAKKQTKKGGAEASAAKEGAPLSILTPDFVCEVVVASFDSLVASVGTTLHMEEDRQVKRKDLSTLLSQFLILYYKSLQSSAREKEFIGKVWYSSSIVGLMNTKTVVLVWESVAQAIAEKGSRLEIESDMLVSLVSSLQRYFAMTFVALPYHKTLLRSLATMVCHTTTKKVDPKTILQVLALFDSIVLDMKRSTTTSAERNELSGEETLDELDSNPTHSSLKQWLHQIGQKEDFTWITMVASSVAAAFVRGELLSSSSSPDEDQSWEPVSGASTMEREMARAIAYLCTLVGRSTNSSTAGELLWPAIHKGISHVPVAMVGTAWSKADCVTRALLLLEEGCRLQVLSGMGNGDLIVDRKTQRMAPPPPNIETILASSVKFILHHISFLVAVDPSKKESAGASRSGNAKKVSATFAYLISQMKILHEAYPSSMAVSSTIDEILSKNIEKLKAASANPGIDDVRGLALTYAALSCGASLPASIQLVEVCRVCLLLEFQKIPGQQRSEEQMARSVFIFSKWGALSCLLPLLLEKEGNENGPETLDSFLQDFRKVAFDAVHGIPVNAMMAYFHCIKVAGRHQLSPSQEAEVDPELICDFISALLALMEEKTASQDAVYMLNEFCALIFQPTLLEQEYQRLRRDPVAGATPIRDAFRKLIVLAGKARPHISKVVLCQVTVGWLGLQGEEQNGTKKVGLGAISFRNDIVELLYHKEMKLDASTMNQSVSRGDGLKGAFELPDGIDDLSIGRGYLLLFFSKLPDLERLHTDVLSDLVHYAIFKLFDEICTEKGKKATLVMLGSGEYVRQIRGWQALCCLSRFVTDDIAEKVCGRVFQAMAEPSHQQIRYFIEIFTLQCARKHPAVFGKAILQTITRRDISLTHMTSVMIIAGNLIVGRYKLEFFTQYEEGAQREAVPLNNVLAGTIPWLGSTQGFSRGIAQLLTHMLIPLVVDVSAPDPSKTESITEQSNWFLLSIYRFLDENTEMKRLRKKQTTFFEQYDADRMCTAEGVLTIPVDEGGEAFPVHMVDVMKQCQKETYEQAEEKEFPQWKHLDDMMQAKDDGDDDLALDEDDALVNFQRKIIPLDELNLAMDTLREKRLRNVAGRKKQQLVVCASLIDKVPNLGGLARTAEIFAAEKLVVPDIGVAKMDNFKKYSVSAGDWIDIEECKEKNLLAFLRSYRAQGYYIVGLEQTSSSAPLGGFRFPNQPILLLLGKEKEGIPVEFLQAVDQCLEIPQLGIIRSLNVHVSGAIAIWEFTKQRLAQES